jgi:glutamyl-tRNA synthetase
MNQNVRVRFAPSPTGALHIGGVRTALYNYLFARQNKGTFILRIEDTDQNRYVEGAENYIFESLDWFGLESTESPLKGGEYAPYRQSERKGMYKQYAQKLVDEGKAYYAFDTKEEIDALKTRLEEAKANQISYNAITRMQMTNSLTLSEEEVKTRIERGDSYIIRIKIPPKDEIRFQDMIVGWVKAHSSTLDDKVLLKEDGLPTYHLANVVDDYLMKITHVIRGKEWLPSAYLHVLLYEFLGWKEVMPQFAHLPLILKPSGKGKLSKRDGIALGIPIFPLSWEDKDDKTGEEQTMQGFREDGFLPEAVLNFLAFLGWNPGTEQEIFSMEELIESFDINRVVKSDAIFDFEKAKWFNQQYLKNTENHKLGELLQAEIKRQNFATDFDLAKLTQVAELMKERITSLNDVLKDGLYFFKTPEEYDEKTVKNRWNEEAKDFVKAIQAQIKDYSSTWNASNLHDLIHGYIEKNDLKMGKTMPALRLAITGLGGGPDLMGIMEVIGKEETIHRLEKAQSSL